MKRLTRALLAAAAAGLLLTGCSSPGQRVEVVEIIGNQYSPTTLTIEPGTEVRWTNLDPEGHTVTSGGPLLPDQQPVPDGAQPFDSGRLTDGETFAHVFEVEGNYAYYCQYHTQMVGTIRVGEP